MKGRHGFGLGYLAGMVGPRRTLRLARRLASLWAVLLLFGWVWFRALPGWQQAGLGLLLAGGLSLALIPRRPRPAAAGWAGAPERRPMDPALRALVIARDGYVCGICRLPITDPTDCQIDHRYPQALGGTDDPANLQPAHSICNQRKGAKVVQPPYRELA